MKLKNQPVTLAKGLFHRSLGQAKRRPRQGIPLIVWLKAIGNEFEYFSQVLFTKRSVFDLQPKCCCVLDPRAALRLP